MTKKMRELMAKYQTLVAEAKALMEGETKDVAVANAKLDEAKKIRNEYEAEKAIAEAEKFGGIGTAKSMGVVGEEPEEKKTAVQKFAAAARAGFSKAMSEGTNSDGGYTVPEDIETQINELRSAKYSLLQDVEVTNVTTNKGRRTYKTRKQQTGFKKVGEKSAIPTKDTPTFTVIDYAVDKYAGVFAVTDELLEDSDANITATLTNWIADESRVTANNLILDEIKAKFAATELSGLDDIKKALNVTLGQAFKPTSKIYTNDDGLQYLDTLKDSDGKYLLQPNPADPMQLRVCAGATIIPVTVLPNADMQSAPVYALTTDTKVTTGKAYYQESGGVYTKVESPETNPSTEGYYEVTSTNVPMIIGDMREAIVYYNRKGLTIKASDTASVSGINAYEDDVTLWRAIEREDVQAKDLDALVNGHIKIK